MEPDYLIGLDLGQSTEYTALAVLERTAHQDPDGSDEWTWSYAVRHLHRFTLGTPYSKVVATLAELTRQAPLHEATLVMDQTSVGLPVVRLFRQAGLPSLRPVTLVAGQDGGETENGVSIPKRELASVLQLVLQGRRLKIAEQLEHAQTLVRELQSFRVKVPTLLNPESAWREREHDDLVFAVGIAVWMGERFGTPDPDGTAVRAGGDLLSFRDDDEDWEEEEFAHFE